MQVFEQFLKKKNQSQTSTVIMLFLILILKIITYFQLFPNRYIIGKN